MDANKAVTVVPIFSPSTIASRDLKINPAIDCHNDEVCHGSRRGLSQDGQEYTECKKISTDPKPKLLIR